MLLHSLLPWVLMEHHDTEVDSSEDLYEIERGDALDGNPAAPPPPPSPPPLPPPLAALATEEGAGPNAQVFPGASTGLPNAGNGLPAVTAATAAAEDDEDVDPEEDAAWAQPGVVVGGGGAALGFPTAKIVFV